MKTNLLIILLFVKIGLSPIQTFGQAAANCSNAGTISCGSSIIGNLAGAGNEFNSEDYSCHQTDSKFDGNDRIYKVEISESR